MKRFGLPVGFCLLEIVWSGYSAMAWLGAAFPDYADDKVFVQMQDFESRLILWRWLAVSLMLGISYIFLRRWSR